MICHSGTARQGRNQNATGAPAASLKSKVQSPKSNAQFKAQAAKWLRLIVGTNQPVIITVNGKPAAVLLSPEEFDRLQERQRFLESVAAGWRMPRLGASWIPAS